jgi:hypothetical protein
MQKLYSLTGRSALINEKIKSRFQHGMPNAGYVSSSWFFRGPVSKIDAQVLPSVKQKIHKNFSHSFLQEENRR